MQINLLCVGKLKERFYRDACAEYQKRMSRYHRLTVTELPDEKPLSGSPDAIQRVMAKEGDRLLPHLQKGFPLPSAWRRGSGQPGLSPAAPRL